MATKRKPYNKKLPAAIANLLECDVCKDMLRAPIFQCKIGHSLCNNCTKSLKLPLCPTCREQMTQVRSLQLEKIVSKAPVPCPNKSSGCKYTLTTDKMDDHVKQCIFRAMDCPQTVFGKCSWNGQLREMMTHFKDRHPNQCNFTSGDEATIPSISVNEDERIVLLVNQGKLLFVVTVKIDTLQNMSYWTIQHIGSKKVAQQHVYEFHITSQLDNRRKVVFTDHCFSDTMKTEEIFQMGKCGMLPLGALAHYIKNKTLKFRFLINWNTYGTQNDNQEENQNDRKTNAKVFYPQGKGKQNDSNPHVPKGKQNSRNPHGSKENQDNSNLHGPKGKLNDSYPHGSKGNQDDRNTHGPNGKLTFVPMGNQEGRNAHVSMGKMEEGNAYGPMEQAERYAPSSMGKQEERNAYGPMGKMEERNAYGSMGQAERNAPGSIGKQEEHNAHGPMGAQEERNAYGPMAKMDERNAYRPMGQQVERNAHSSIVKQEERNSRGPMGKQEDLSTFVTIEKLEEANAYGAKGKQINPYPCSPNGKQDYIQYVQRGQAVIHSPNPHYSGTKAAEPNRRNKAKRGDDVCVIA